MGRRLAIAVMLAALLATAASAVPDAASAAKRTRKAAALKPFASCKSLLRYARRNALRRLEPDITGPLLRRPSPFEDRGQLAPQIGGPVSEGFSQTNVQETGVDEPDITKTNGSHIFAAVRGRLEAVDVRGATPQRVGTLRLGPNAGDDQLLLRGDRLLVISRPSTFGAPIPEAARLASVAFGGSSKTVLFEVDVSRPEAMRIVRGLTVKGSYVDGRLTDGTARVVISTSPPALDLSGPVAPGVRAYRRTRRRNRASLRRSRLNRWVPSYQLRDRRTRRKVTRRLVRCRAVRRATVFSGLDMLSVLTINLDKGLPPVDSDALMTDADLVYGSKDSLYVATPRDTDEDLSPERQARGMTTQIHRFATSNPEVTTYEASGRVRGFLLNQFSMSEHAGHLRVASTSEPVDSDGGRDRDSESSVTVLAQRAGKLVRLGHVGGLGRGERVFAVRFIGDTGYVVTFRQVDPLYTLDLSAPTAPRVLGELKIRGYSAYLHPAGDDLLIGVGQDATRAGRTLGTQLSLFDVSDLRNPRRLHRRTIAAGSSQAELDHHAFLWWAPARLAVLPMDVAAAESHTGPTFTGAIGFRIERTTGIAEVGRITHGTGRDAYAIRRSIVVGDRLYTLSDKGLGVNGLVGFGGLGYVAFR